MFITITFFGIKWFWLVLAAGIVFYGFRYVIPANYNINDPEKVKELLDSRKDLGEKQFNSFNEGRFKTYKELSQNNNVKLNDVEDDLGEGVTIADKGNIFVDIWVAFKPKK